MTADPMPSPRPPSTLAALWRARTRRFLAFVVCLGLGLVSACRDDSAPAEVVVYAAASTRDALAGIDAAFEAEHGVRVVVNFGSSGDLARQIVAAGRADVFLSADEQEMDRVEQAGLVIAGSRVDLLSNQLVVIAPADHAAPAEHGAPAGASFTPRDLLREEFARLSLANPATVPAGRYAKAWLESQSLWSGLESRVVPAIDVRAALAAVESGAAQAGIVYRTDVARSKRVRVLLEVPVDAGPRITYPAAQLRGAAAPDVAAKYLAFLQGESARRGFEEQGFTRLSPSGPGAADARR